MYFLFLGTHDHGPQVSFLKIANTQNSKMHIRPWLDSLESLNIKRGKDIAKECINSKTGEMKERLEKGAMAKIPKTVAGDRIGDGNLVCERQVVEAVRERAGGIWILALNDTRKHGVLTYKRVSNTYSHSKS